MTTSVPEQDVAGPVQEPVPEVRSGAILWSISSAVAMIPAGIVIVLVVWGAITAEDGFGLIFVGVLTICFGGPIVFGSSFIGLGLAITGFFFRPAEGEPSRIGLTIVLAMLLGIHALLMLVGVVVMASILLLGD